MLLHLNRSVPLIYIISTLSTTSRKSQMMGLLSRNYMHGCLYLHSRLISWDLLDRTKLHAHAHVANPETTQHICVYMHAAHHRTNEGRLTNDGCSKEIIERMTVHACLVLSHAQSISCPVKTWHSNWVQLKTIRFQSNLLPCYKEQKGNRFKKTTHTITNFFYHTTSHTTAGP